MFLPPQAQALADEQHGLLGRFQLVPEMMTEGQVDGLVYRKLLVPRQRAIYATHGAASFPEQEALAAQLRARPAARVSGPFVLGLLQVDGFSVHDPFAILTSPDRRLSGVSFRHWRNPRPEDISRHSGKIAIPETALVLIHAAGLLGDAADRRIRVAFHSLQWRKMLSTERLAVVADGLRASEPGVDLIRRMLADGVFGGESIPETDLAAILRELPARVQRQVWVAPHIRVDYLLVTLRIVIEYLGAVDHDGARRREYDSKRDAQLRELGFLPVYLRREHLHDPAGTLEFLTTIVTDRAEDLGVGLPDFAPPIS